MTFKATALVTGGGAARPGRGQRTSRLDAAVLLLLLAALTTCPGLLA
ncbi:Protein of unknown function [Gryllus bimaculatus]|nr:Protein of unknown function [Gryllus bimaculatus]